MLTFAQNIGTPLTPSPSSSNHLVRLHLIIERWAERLRPWHWVWPPVAFATGVASFFLVQRQQWLGILLAAGMILTWLLLLSESLIERRLQQRGLPVSPRGLMTFITQMVHQETLFFTLPFLLATTVWTSGQALFTLAMLCMAVLSILDPLYYRLAEHKRWLYIVFHAQCVFLIVLVTLPLILQLTTTQSLVLASLCMVVFSLPSLLQLLSPMTPGRWLAMFALLPLLASLAWFGRYWVPPATLWLSGSALSPSFDVEARQPQGSIALTPEALKAQGLYAYTAIHAPRGLREDIVHEWYRDGKLVDRIPLEIHGGRAKGYRAWTHKTRFPDDSMGRWRIDVMTSGGQRIGEIHFNVSDNPDNATLANGNITPQVGIPGLNLHWRSTAPEPTAGQQTPIEKEPARPSPQAGADDATPQASKASSGTSADNDAKDKEQQENKKHSSGKDNDDSWEE